MKFRKPQWSGETAGRFYFDACMTFISDLPAEFEIVPEGHVCVKWPGGLTRERLARAARDLHDIVATCGGELCNPASANGRNILEALAAIAPERKKRMVNIWKDKCGCDRLRDVGWSDPQCGWRKVAGPIEIDD